MPRLRRRRTLRTRLAFASGHEIIGAYYAYQIYTVRADGTGLGRLTDDRAEKGNPAWIRRLH